VPIRKHTQATQATRDRQKLKGEVWKNPPKRRTTRQQWAQASSQRGGEVKTLASCDSSS